MMNLDNVPKNLEESIDFLAKGIMNTEADFLSKQTTTGTLVYAFAEWLCRNWSLDDRETVLVQWFRTELGILHPLDIANTMLEGLKCKLMKKEFDALTWVNKYKAHWMARGVNPATMGKL